MADGKNQKRPPAESSLTPEQRRERAVKAVAVRWAKPGSRKRQAQVLKRVWAAARAAAVPAAAAESDPVA